MKFVEEIKNIYSGKNVYIIAKGTSLNFLKKEDIGEGIVITLNQAIEKVESLGLPNIVYSMQKDRIVSKVAKSTTLLLQTGYSADDAGKKIKFKEFANEDLDLPHDAFSALSAIQLAKLMGCVKFYFVSFDAITNGNLDTFDGSKPYFEMAYVSHKHRMKPYLEEINHEFITPSLEPVVVLVTPTGGRKKQIQLCAKWMKNQTYSGKVVWIIVDDCEEKTTDFIKSDFRDNWEIVHLYPTPVWKEGDNTQSRNLKVGIEEVKKYNATSIFIIEDDDYYKPTYIEYMCAFLRGGDICGEIKTMYFNVNLLFFKRCLNAHHCSLFQTAFTQKMIPLFLSVLEKNFKFIDIEFFKNAQEAKAKIMFFKGLNLSIGIKGLPGRKGIGSGHQLDIYKLHEQPKTNQGKINEIKNLIGDDYVYYMK